MNTSSSIRTPAQAHNVIRGRHGAQFSSVEILEGALRSGAAVSSVVTRRDPETGEQLTEQRIVWQFSECGRSVAHEYLAAMRREEREFMALVDVPAPFPFESEEAAS